MDTDKTSSAGDLRDPGRFDSVLFGVSLWRTWGRPDTASDEKLVGPRWRVNAALVRNLSADGRDEDLLGLVMLNATLDYGDAIATGSAGVVGTITMEPPWPSSAEEFATVVSPLLDRYNEALYDVARRALTAQAAAMDITLDLALKGLKPVVETIWPPIDLDGQ